MRTPKRHVTTKGEVYFRVRYRHGGKQRAMPFYGDNAEAEALEFAGLLSSLGDDKAVEWWNRNLDQEPGTQGLLLVDWWPRYLGAVTGITDGTRITYQRTFWRVWAPPLGLMPLTAIGREDIAKVINQMSADGKSDKTIRNAYGILATCLKVALQDGHIPALPTKNIRLPRATEHTDTEMRFLTPTDWEKLYTCLPVHYRPLFTFLIGTGARWGEAEALTVGDVDLDRYLEQPDGTLLSTPVVAITKAAKWNASKSTRTVGPTKTRRSRRTIYIGPVVADALTPLVADRPKAERLFLAPKGGQLRHRTVYDSWKKACQAAGLDPQPRIHDLRHTYASWQIARGTPLTVIQRNLGHEKITTTSDTYGHLLPEIELAAAEAASYALQPRAITGGSET